jgi:hypothetical protein
MHIEWSNNCFVDGTGDDSFKLGARFSSTPTDYIVDLKVLACTCKRWEQIGNPYPHEILHEA